MNTAEGESHKTNPPEGETATMIANRTIFVGDNLDVMRGMDDASIDLIYLDPPFNSKKDWAAPVGSKAAGAFFKDTWYPEDLDGREYDVEELASQHPAVFAACLHQAAPEATLERPVILPCPLDYVDVFLPLGVLRRQLMDCNTRYAHAFPGGSIIRDK